MEAGQGDGSVPISCSLLGPRKPRAEEHPSQMMSKKSPATPWSQERQCGILGAGMGLKKRRKVGKNSGNKRPLFPTVSPGGQGAEWPGAVTTAGATCQVGARIPRALP